MNPSQTRLKLSIDVFEQPAQEALALPELKPPQLVKAILQEFRSLEYLGDDPQDYVLVRLGDGEPLVDETPLGEQAKQGERLALVEREVPLPQATSRPSLPIYLREPAESRTFGVKWLPAIIGRRSEHQPFDEWVAVDLRGYVAGLHVSRRHVRLTQHDGSFFVENLSSNPVSLLSPSKPDPVAVVVGAPPRPLLPDDVIRLDRSGIELKFITRPAAAAPAVEEPAPSGEEPTSQEEDDHGR